jgi:cytochrome c oxidase subunit II
MRCSELLRNTVRRCSNRKAVRWIVLTCALFVAGCSGVQSALDPAGREAERIANLFWWMLAGAVIVWFSLVGLTVYSVRARPESQNKRRAGLLIIGGGALVPTVVLAVLLVYGLSLLPALVAPAPEGSLKVSVTGEQWWWRVRYEPHGVEAVVLANEIRLPVGEPVEFRLESADVIHSFWIPSLGGKVDMIPGRQTRLALVPTKTGVLRGVCAEYCGTSHALMSFQVEIMEKEEFVRWLAHQASPAERAADPLAARGQELFLAQGCSACHTIRGTPAGGVIGPDLTHVGSRLGLGAGILPNEPDAFLQWIANTENEKPGVHMPAFGMLPQEELQALAAYLEGLK